MTKIVDTNLKKVLGEWESVDNILIEILLFSSYLFHFQIFVNHRCHPAVFELILNIVQLN